MLYVGLSRLPPRLTARVPFGLEEVVDPSKVSDLHFYKDPKVTPGWFAGRLSAPHSKAAVGIDRTPQRIICYECGKQFRTAALLAEHAQRHRKTQAKAAKARRAKDAAKAKRAKEAAKAKRAKNAKRKRSGRKA